MTKKLIPSDPLYAQQWHLKAIGDMETIWAEFTGVGITSAVYDNGIDVSHEDLAANFDATKQIYVNGVLASSSAGAQDHGTKVAGVIAGANNGIGGVGVSFDAKITGVTLIGSDAVTDSVSAFRAMATFDTVNNSWGFNDRFADNVTAGLGASIRNAISYAASTGRKGLGTIITNAAGNEGGGNDTNSTGFSQNRQTITVGAIGRDGDVADYATRGASILVSAPSMTYAGDGSSGIVTTAPGGYATDFNGTSASTPIVTGVANLMLSANAGLGWRDVQEIMAVTANHTAGNLAGGVSGRMVSGWTINKADTVDGGGAHFSNDVGFGLIDGFEAVRYAQAWKEMGLIAQTSANEQTTSASGYVSRSLADGAAASFSFMVARNIEIEHVDLTLRLTHQRVNDLRIELVSPEGTKTVVLAPLSGATMTKSSWTWVFGSEALRGELSAGKWTVNVIDTATNNLSGSIATYRLDVYGETVNINDVYNYTNEFGKLSALESQRSVLSDTDGGTDWINAAGLQTDSIVRLTAGAASQINNAALTISSGVVIENAITGDGADLIEGNDVANVLKGMRGNDTLTGGLGADALDGGQDDDSLEGGRDDDVIDGGDGYDRVVFSGNRGDYTIVQGADVKGVYYAFTDMRSGVNDGVDRVYNVEAFQFADQTIVPLAASDLLEVAPPPAPVNDFVGTPGADVLSGNAEANLLDALSGDDTLIGGLGADTLRGGLGRDVADYSTADGPIVINGATGVNAGAAEGDSLESIEVIVGSAYADMITAGGDINEVRGGSGNDTLIGSGSADTLEGGDGDDVIVAGGGADVIFGGAGFDQVSYAGSAAVSVTLATGAIAGGSGDGDTLAEIEGVIGSAFDDTLIGSTGADLLFGASGNDMIEGGAGADTLLGGEGVDTVSYALSSAAVSVNLTTGAASGGDAAGDTLEGFENIIGSSGSDMLVGSSDANILSGGDGNDTLAGGPGGDRLIGGAGVDTADYGAASAGVVVNLATGARGGEATGDTFETIEILRGSAFGDVIVLGPGVTAVYALAGNDTLTGGAAADRLEGGDGDDMINVSTGADTIVGGAGNDTVSFASYTSAVLANLMIGTYSSLGGAGTISGVENALGGRGSDILTGSDEANRLDGGVGNDTLSGGRGDDTLAGGAGNDSLIGGTGRDFFRFDAMNFGQDLVKDFVSGEDLLAISGRGALTIADVSQKTSGNNLVIGFNASTDTITLAGLGATRLKANDFFFG